MSDGPYRGHVDAFVPVRRIQPPTLAPRVTDPDRVPLLVAAVAGVTCILTAGALGILMLAEVLCFAATGSAF